MPNQNDNKENADQPDIGGGWNYRVMRRVYKSPHAPNGVEEEYGIYEVYYDSDNNPNGYSKDARPITAESLEGLRWVHERIAEALAKPVLEYKDG